MHDRPVGTETLLCHLGEEEKILGAVTPPVFLNSLFTFPSIDGLFGTMSATPGGPPHHYSRISNPTADVAEKKLAALEGTDHAKLFGSGMGAISAGILSTVAQGSHVVCVDTAYGPTKELLAQYLPRFGVTTTFVDGRTVDSVFDAVKPETSLIYLETPSSILFRMQDVPAIATMIDNTYSTPLYFQPHRHGVDLVAHSASKYLGGHSDVVAGALSMNRARFEPFLRQEVGLLGGMLQPFSAWMVLRGMRTLAVRVPRHEQTANTVAAYLESRPEVEVVHHLGLPSYPQRDLVTKIMNGTTGLFSFEPKVQDSAKVKAFCDALQIFQRGVSWGGFESLVVTLKMKPLDWDEPRWVIRLFCGLETPADLISDLDQAMVHLH